MTIRHHNRSANNRAHNFFGRLITAIFTIFVLALLAATPANSYAHGQDNATTITLEQIPALVNCNNTADCGTEYLFPNQKVVPYNHDTSETVTVSFANLRANRVWRDGLYTMTESQLIRGLQFDYGMWALDRITPANQLGEYSIVHINRRTDATPFDHVKFTAPGVWTLKIVTHGFTAVIPQGQLFEYEANITLRRGSQFAMSGSGLTCDLTYNGDFLLLIEREGSSLIVLCQPDGSNYSGMKFIPLYLPSKNAGIDQWRIY